MARSPFLPVGLAGLLLAALALAMPAAAESVIELAAARAGVFHHLDASGRRALAVAGERVGLVWEDNRDGAPACHFASKTTAETGFREFRFGTGECFEPAIAADGADAFLLIWEDETGVQAARAGANGVGAATRLAPAGGQGAIIRHPEQGVIAVWSAPDGRWRRLWRARLDDAGDGGLIARAAAPVDPQPARDDQAYPTLAVAGPERHLVLVWEDRRPGHTVIFASRSADAAAWSAPARVSRNPTGAQPGGLGRGTGAMRPAIAAFGARLAVVWLDKRDFLSGYDVYAAFSDDGGASFGDDLKVQDSFGDAIAQWHAAVAGNPRGDLRVVWSDDRDGNADLWLNRPAGTAFGDDFTLPEVSGPAHQADPAIALDDAGNLHLAWLERDAGGATRLRYLRRPASGGD